MVTVEQFQTLVGRCMQDLSRDIAKIRCPDKWVGNIGSLVCPFIYSNISDAPIKDCRVFLILESPHKKELQGDPAPAKGASGKNIVELLDKFLGGNCKLIGSQGLPLCIVNAVSFQCSLGLPLSKYGGVKDFVFQCAMNSSLYQEDLRERLESFNLSRKNRVVIACSNDPELTSPVEMIIERMGVTGEENFVRRYWHPISWRRMCKHKGLLEAK